jgi:hypothetical protein
LRFSSILRVSRLAQNTSMCLINDETGEVAHSTQPAKGRRSKLSVTRQALPTPWAEIDFDSRGSSVVHNQEVPVLDFFDQGIWTVTSIRVLVAPMIQSESIRSQQCVLMPTISGLRMKDHSKSPG